MKKANNHKQALLKSALVLLLCFAMLIGSTFAWFTDQVTTVSNVIQSGKLDIEMYWTDDLDTNVWYNVEDGEHSTVFSYDNWEPGYTDVKYIKLVNKGNLALNYQLTLTPESGIGKLAEVINVYYSQDGVEVETREDLQELGAVGLLDSVLNGGATVDGTLLAQDQQSPFHPTGEVVITLAMSMLTSAGNEYQNEDAGTFTITALATQAPFESDSFGSDYDANAEYPTILTAGSATASVTPVDGKVPAGGVTLVGEGISAYVPEGVVLEEGVTELTLTKTPLKKTTSDINPVNDETLLPVDVHIEGVADTNTVPIVISLGEIMPKYLNMGNYYLIHVEDSGNQTMTMVDDVDDLTAHNQFVYNSDTGEVTVSMATFSEIAFVIANVNKWQGGYDYEFRGSGDSANDPYIISSADELAGLSAIVGGMNGQTQNSYTGKYFKLISFIDLGGNTQTFYPIGYYNNTGEYVKKDDGVDVEHHEGVVSNVYSFEGTFDGNGYTIYNIYQNTWDMFGDYNDGYSANSNHYKDAMGLFGYVVNGTIKNLNVQKFESDGEFTPTGVIAAYAVNSTFENIAIFDCNPRVYNTGNGGIVGIGGNNDDKEAAKQTLTFKNITVDSSNKITALWGSWDVACGGIMGMLRGETYVDFENCHVAAQIDVYNDVCGNYQYYWYRYAGMMIGTNKLMTTDADGYTVPVMDRITAKNCTVRFDEWNDYYYCELVENSLASYTHDHQFSRLQVIESLSEIRDESGNWDTTGNFILFDADDDRFTDESGTCYHIRKDSNGDLYEHEHTAAGYETTDVDGDGKIDSNMLKEDRQRYYLPFNQLFTGYGWGVKHIPIYEDTELTDLYPNLDIKILDRLGDSVVKFKSNYASDYVLHVGTDDEFKLSELFDETFVPKVEIDTKNIKITVENFDKSGEAPLATLTQGANWYDSVITFTSDDSAIGKKVELIIQDYHYCIPTVMVFYIAESVDLPDTPEDTTSDWVAITDVTQIQPGNNYIIVNKATGLTLSNSYSASEEQFALSLSTTVEDYWQFTEGVGGLKTEDDGTTEGYYEPTEAGTVIQSDTGNLVITYVPGENGEEGNWLIYNYDGQNDLNFLTADGTKNAVTSHPEQYGDEIPEGSYWVIYGSKEDLVKLEEDTKALQDKISQNTSDANFTFAFAGDTHIGNTEAALMNLRSMYDDLAAQVAGGLKLDTLFLTADLTDNSYETAWYALSCVGRWYSTKGVTTYTTIGNHDARTEGYQTDTNKPATWQESSKRYYNFVSNINEKEVNAFASQTSPYYHVEINGYDVVVLATEDAERDNAQISQTQLKWFENTLAEIQEEKGSDQSIIVVTHQPINNTLYSYRTIGQHIGDEGEELKAIIAKYPQVVCISSHLHYPPESCKAINTGEGIYIEAPALYSSGCYRVVQIYDDYLVVKTRYVEGDGAGEATGKWMDDYEIKVPLKADKSLMGYIAESPTSYQNYVLVNKATDQVLNNDLTMGTLSTDSDEWTFIYEKSFEAYAITVPGDIEVTNQYLATENWAGLEISTYRTHKVVYNAEKGAYQIYRYGSSNEKDTYLINDNGTAKTMDVTPGQECTDDRSYWELKVKASVPADGKDYVIINKQTQQMLEIDTSELIQPSNADPYYKLKLEDIPTTIDGLYKWSASIYNYNYWVDEARGKFVTHLGHKVDDKTWYLKPNKGNAASMTYYANYGLVFNYDASKNAFQINRTSTSDGALYLTVDSSGAVSGTISTADTNSFWEIYLVN